MEEIHTRCAFRPFCTQTYEDPPRDSKYNCNKCIGHYVSEKIEKVDKDASKPKRRSQNFTFHRLGNGGFYEGVSETVTYYDNRRRRPEAPDEGGADELGDDPPREPGHKGSRREKGHGRRRRRRSRREGDGEADGGSFWSKNSNIVAARFAKMLVWCQEQLLINCLRCQAPWRNTCVEKLCPEWVTLNWWLVSKCPTDLRR